MNSVDEPELTEYEGVVEVSYNSDGILALSEGDEYSLEGESFHVAETDQIITVEEGSSVYIQEEADFSAYDIIEFSKVLAETYGETDIFDSGNTPIFNPNKTPIWSPDDKQTGSGTKIFDPSDYDIGTPTEYVSMMKENADTIILELAEKGVTGEEASETLDQLFTSMNDTYDEFVHSPQNAGTGSDNNTKLFDDEKKGSEPSKLPEDQKKKLIEQEASEQLQNVEDSLEEIQSSGQSVDDYVDAEELVNGAQTETFDFESDVSPEQGQSEISDWEN